ncbi:MAG: hypothetical protein K2H70_00815 [Bacteroidales bacterium]|nr:hypothetical protein [Bacteroidales bacterium]
MEGLVKHGGACNSGGVSQGPVGRRHRRSHRQSRDRSRRIHRRGHRAATLNGLFILSAAAGLAIPDRHLQAQTTEPPDETALETAFEALAETLTDDETAATSTLALETLQDRLAHPLCINTATYDDLEALGLLTPWEIEALLRYRNDYGTLTGAHELLYIPDFPAEKARRLAPLLSFEPAAPSESLNQPLKRHGRHELALRYGRALYRSKAYTERRYAGTPDAVALRYRFKAEDRLQIGLALEKDAGEKRIPDSWSGFVAFGDAHRNSQGKPRSGSINSWIIGTY